ncbi:hypothetical protein [Cryptosporangium aurantiacum]|uniref:hypothetical protein n=1 Tax=Cryptosporangium aurantiacum TaxID=134849 RepID=UPI000933B261|nr:hypothetical protein [Cryptosporangium aurantiacum]
MTTPPAEWALRIAAVLVGTVITVTSEVIAAFLTPFRIGAQLIPISWAIVVIGVVLGVAITRYGSGVAGATAIPAVAFFLVLWPLSSRTSEGDVVVPGTWVGYGVLLLGLMAIVGTVAVTMSVSRPRRSLG